MPTESNKAAELITDLVVLGSGPGGYTAAFRAADLGVETVLVERYPVLGGVCLNVGCIPSKALLHAAKVISEAREMAEAGIDFGKPKIDTAKLLKWKQQVVGKLTAGLSQLAKQRKVQVVQGTGKFISPNQIAVSGGGKDTVIQFRHAIIAAGSQSARLPFLPEDPRIMDSTSALQLEGVPQRLLVIGGGIIGLEMATVFHELGSRVTVVEVLDKLMTGADPDLVRPLQRRIEKQYEHIYTGTKVTAVAAENAGLKVSFEGNKAPKEDSFDRILVAVGRSPNGKRINAESAGVNVDERGLIAVDNQQRTNVPHIFAIGDLVGQPMLAHKASHEGKVAAEVVAGKKSAFDARVIPSVAYTDPEVAWVGLTETEAKQKGMQVGKGVFPWAASGRSLSLGRSDGMTKLLFDEATHRILGAGIVGPNAGDLIAEAALAIEMGADAADIGLTIHPHPTLSETIMMAAEAYEGTLTDLYIPKKT
ncbi:MAG: dihydrolipoyl dehydrogenase [Gammaproteobacteria bacterium]|nr:dihydrolipoyl dehydrogenase [Gammaproteobacteria bacterium]